MKHNFCLVLSVWREKKNSATKNRLLLLLKKVDNARLIESDSHPISIKTPASQSQPIERKK